MVAYRAQMPLRPSADGAWTKAQLTALTKAAGSVASDQTLLLDDEHVPIDVLCGKIRRYVRDQGVRVVGIDYLTQIPASEKYKGNKRMETTEVSNKLRVLAKELQISIVLLSQLSRAQDVYDKELDEYVQPRPKMSSLKETSAIEEDAHVIIGIHRDDRIDPNSAEAIFLKNRAGQCPLIRMTFKGATYTFSER